MFVGEHDDLAAESRIQSVWHYVPPHHFGAPHSSFRPEHIRQPDYPRKAPNLRGRLWMFKRRLPTLLVAVSATWPSGTATTTCREGSNSKRCNCSAAGATTGSSDATTAARPHTWTRRGAFPLRRRVARAPVELRPNSATGSQAETAPYRLEYQQATMDAIDHHPRGQGNSWNSAGPSRPALRQSPGIRYETTAPFGAPAMVTFSTLPGHAGLAKH